MQTWRESGHVRPKPASGPRHAKLEAHRALLLERVEARSDITMPELAAELQSATGVCAAPATLSRWLRRNGYRFKKKRCWPASKIVPTSGRPVANGATNVSP